MPPERLTNKQNTIKLDDIQVKTRPLISRVSYKTYVGRPWQMAIRTFPATTGDDAIRQLVVEWSELLAEKRYADAIAMFDVAEPELTPDELERWIVNYGSPDTFPDGRTFELTSMLALDNAADIIANSIEIDRDNLYGLDPADYVGMVHYDDVPLNNAPSDLTARFHIKRVGNDQLTLEFLDIHVM